MYEYRSSRPSRRKKGVGQVVLPILIVLLLVGIIWAGWTLVSRIWVSGNRSSSDVAAQVMVDEGSVKIKLSDTDNFESIGGSVELFPEERVKAEADASATIFFSSDAEIRMNRDSQVELLEFEEKEGAYQIKSHVEDGMVWASVGNLAPTGSTFALHSDYVQVTGDSASFAVEYPGTVYVVEGNLSVEVVDGAEGGSGDLLTSVNLGVGQQLLVDEDSIEDLKGGQDPDLMFALSDDFKETTFYRNNAEKDGLLVAGSSEEQNEEGSEEEEESDPNEEEPEETEEENTNEEQEENEEEDEPVVTGEVKITSPSDKNEYDSDTMDFNVEAKVPSNTAKVVINGGYTLQQYNAGDSVAKYYVRKDTGNVQQGKNTYRVTAFDKNDNKIGEDSIVVNVTVDEQEEEDEEEEENTSEESSNPGTVSITSPSSNASYTSSTGTFDVKASVPSNTDSVTFNGYRLTLYTPGDQTATYFVKPENGNVKIDGSKNVYTVIAYDDENKQIGSDTITITVNTGGNEEEGNNESSDDNEGEGDQNEAGDNANGGSLGFSSPISGGTYSTTLKELPVSGPAPSNAKNLYLNGITVDSFSPGNATWSTVFNLEPGENTITINGDDTDDNPLPGASITVDYQGN